MLQQPVDETSALQRLPPAGSGPPAPRRVFPSKGLRRSEERCEVPSGRRPAEPLRHGNRSLGLACVDAGETGGREPARDNPPDALAAVPRSRSLFDPRIVLESGLDHRRPRAALRAVFAVASRDVKLLLRPA